MWRRRPPRRPSILSSRTGLRQDATRSRVSRTTAGLALSLASAVIPEVGLHPVGARLNRTIVGLDPTHLRVGVTRVGFNPTGFPMIWNRVGFGPTSFPMIRNGVGFSPTSLQDTYLRFAFACRPGRQVLLCR
jgi:hypothetical protein